jgi:hypothetical protein
MVVARLLKRVDLSQAAKVVNNGRTDGVSFYVSGCESVTVSAWWYEMSEEKQKSELKWFLKGYEYELINE